MDINIETHQKLARYLHINLDKINNIQLPVKQINNVNCNVYILKINNSIKLLITAKNISYTYDNDDDDYKKLKYYEKTISSKCDEKDDYMHAIQQIYESLRLLRFDKINGVFKNIDEIDDINILEELLNDVNINSYIESCCICTDKTYTKTHCNHSLCYVCWDQIKCNENYEIKCPLCRKDINNIIK